MQFTVIDGVLSSVSNDDIKDDGSFVIPDGVIAIGKRAFENCTRLKTLTIPDGVTSIREGAFSNCSGLQELIISKGVTYIGDVAFRRCSSLQKLTIPDGVTSIGDWVFLDCRGLQELTLPNGLTFIGIGAFRGCSGLQTLTLPNGVTFINHEVFWGCISLQTVIIPKGVTFIGSDAFNGCSGLREFTIPEGLTSIDIGAFNGCIGLQILFIPEDFPNTASFVFDAFPNINSIVINSMNDDAIKRIINLVPENLRSKITPPELVTEAWQWMKEELSRVARTPEINPLYPFNKAISVKYRAISDDTLNEISSYLLNDLIYYQNAQKLMQSVPLPKNADELIDYKGKLSCIADAVINKAVLLNRSFQNELNHIAKEEQALREEGHLDAADAVKKLYRGIKEKYVTLFPKDVTKFKEECQELINEARPQLERPRDLTLVLSYSFFKTDTAQKISSLETMIDEVEKAQQSLLSLVMK